MYTLLIKSKKKKIAKKVYNWTIKEVIPSINGYYNLE